MPECSLTPPPKPERYIKASADERLVLMTNAYISQTKNIRDCNAKIRLVNASNKAVSK